MYLNLIRCCFSVPYALYIEKQNKTKKNSYLPNLIFLSMSLQIRIYMFFVFIRIHSTQGVVVRTAFKITFMNKAVMTSKVFKSEWSQKVSLVKHLRLYPASIYLLKVNNRNTRTRCEICSKLTIKTPERRHNFELISHLVLVFVWLT